MDANNKTQAGQPGIAISAKGNGLHCLDGVSSDPLCSVVVNLASRCSGGLVATLIPVQIVLRFHRLLGFISLAWLRLVKCIEGNAEIEKT